MENYKIHIYEMFMRDGLQSLNKTYSIEDKICFIDLLYNANFRNIEFGSTTNPKLLLQMDNSYQLWDYIKKTYIYDDTCNEHHTKSSVKTNFTMLVTNQANLQKCIKSNIKSFGLLSSLSDQFGIKNLNKNSDDSFQEMFFQLKIIYENRRNNDYHTRIYLSCFFGTIEETFDDTYEKKCIYYLNKIMNFIKIYKLEPENIDIVLCDTYGVLDDKNLDLILQNINSYEPDIIKYISLHLHCNTDFYNLINSGLKNNISKFDSSILNVGGCPFSGKNIHNINTYELVKYLEEAKYKTSLDYKKIKELEEKIKEILQLFCQT